MGDADSQDAMRRRPVRIAMWSGPRNISTAMMRSFGNRGDTAVCDEPFYGHYLKATGLDHPGADEVIAHHETDWENVVAFLIGPVPDGKRVFYQKHMTHHLLSKIDRAWMQNEEFVHVFLIRDPAEMMTSLDKVLPRVRLEDTGLPQQVVGHRRGRLEAHGYSIPCFGVRVWLGAHSIRRRGTAGHAEVFLSRRVSVEWRNQESRQPRGPSTVQPE